MSLNLDTAYREHAAITQLYRWYSFYENPAISLNQQLELLDENLIINSPMGKIESKKNYCDHMISTNPNRANAHQILSAEFIREDQLPAHISAKIVYISSEQSGSGSHKTLTMEYKIELSEIEGLLPQFLTFDIQIIYENSTPDFHNTYQHSRGMALLNYWLALVENPNRSASPFREIICEDFKFDFGNGIIDTSEAFEAWIAGPASSVSKTAHKIENFRCISTAKDKYEIDVEFDWLGLRPDGKTMSARTHHVWTVHDDPRERFSRVGKIDVKIIRPFAVITENEG